MIREIFGANIQFFFSILYKRKKTVRSCHKIKIELCKINFVEH